MIITEVYKKYRLTKNLQEHHLRVAAVAKQICDNLTVPVDSKTIIEACLLHDTGNILKFDFSQPDDFFEPEGKQYWQQVKREVEEKYQARDEHELSLMIARELGMGEKVLECINRIGFDSAEENLTKPEIEPKVCDNADLRVGPYGVLSVKERLEDGRRRYQHRPDKWISLEQWEKMSSFCFELEKQLFTNVKIKPEDITDASIAPLVEELRTYEITT